MEKNHKSGVFKRPESRILELQHEHQYAHSRLLQADRGFLHFGLRTRQIQHQRGENYQTPGEERRRQHSVIQENYWKPGCGSGLVFFEK